MTSDCPCGPRVLQPGPRGGACNGAEDHRAYDDRPGTTANASTSKQANTSKERNSE